ncbi:MAG: DUF4355 domain-containing protein, partial [Methanomassiliicoccaceae archaeon]|nr:DUF4355 domain-containing protein [Methanomassiliicoccaceae archaeon]
PAHDGNALNYQVTIGMTEEEKAAEATEPKGGESKPLSMTQDELNALIGKVRAGAKERHDKELAKAREGWERERKLASMKEEERAAAERDMELERLSGELAASRRELRTRAAEAELAKLELDPALAGAVLGDNDEATAANIAALKKQVDGMVKRQLDGMIGAGAPKGGAAPARAGGVDAARLRGGGYSAQEIEAYLASKGK